MWQPLVLLLFALMLLLMWIDLVHHGTYQKVDIFVRWHFMRRRLLCQLNQSADNTSTFVFAKNITCLRNWQYVWQLWSYSHFSGQFGDGLLIVNLSVTKVWSPLRCFLLQYVHRGVSKRCKRKGTFPACSDMPCYRQGEWCEDTSHAISKPWSDYFDSKETSPPINDFEIPDSFIILFTNANADDVACFVHFLFFGRWIVWI